ncbi:hypothetical protein [Mesorhizobium sp. WSM2561]|uniref:hypothetical protein n=1 Tax=Mesorhizobium sp. WSM2561 TaxID=1040985 RepID=UPI000488844A|nr:hypothetical protein [Mesorhizobium sp. WSM2561]
MMLINFANGLATLGKNRAAIAEAAFRRLVAVLPKEKPGSIEHDFWQTIQGFEMILSDERGKTTRLTRTRQKVARLVRSKR